MQPRNPVLDYLDAISRYRLVAACTLVVGAILTAWTVRTLPDHYRSTTLIMVESQDVPSSVVKETVTTRVEERLNALSEEVLSRTRLEAIINDFDLFPDQRAQQVPREQIVETMRKRILIQVLPRDNAFRISYDGEDPATVQRVTARLAGLYIDENLRIREQRASGTAEFLESELGKVKRQLDDQEAGIKGFKQEHMGELPEQREANMRALEGLRLQLQTVSMALSSANERKVLLDRQASDARGVRAPQSGQSGGPILSPRARLQELEAQLSELRVRYTDQHPDVVSLVRQIAHLRADLAQGGAADSAAADPLLPPDLAHALVAADVEIKRLTAERESLEKEIASYQERVENGFGREQQLLALTRDYEVTQKNYQTMLGKKLDAQLSQSLERRQKGERFRVLDPASLPEAPARPNRPLLTLLGVGGSLALAILLPLGLWQLDTSFHLADELVAYALPVLAVIPQVTTTDIRRRLWRYRMRVLGLSVLGLVLGLSASTLYGRYLF